MPNAFLVIMGQKNDWLDDLNGRSKVIHLREPNVLNVGHNLTTEGHKKGDTSWVLFTTVKSKNNRPL